MSKLIIFLFLFSSCASRHIQRSNTFSDSTVNTTATTRKLDASTETEVKKTTVKDSSGQSVTFSEVPAANNSVVSEKWQTFYSAYARICCKDSCTSLDSCQMAELARYFKEKFKPVNTVKFKDGKIVEASGNVTAATAANVLDTHIEDSLRTENFILQDSIQTLQASKRTETHTKDKTTRSWWWLWFIIGLLGGGWIGWKLRAWAFIFKNTQNHQA